MIPELQAHISSIENCESNDLETLVREVSAMEAIVLGGDHAIWRDQLYELGTAMLDIAFRRSLKTSEKVCVLPTIFSTVAYLGYEIVLDALDKPKWTIAKIGYLCELVAKSSEKQDLIFHRTRLVESLLRDLDSRYHLLCCQPESQIIAVPAVNTRRHAFGIRSGNHHLVFINPETENADDISIAEEAIAVAVEAVLNIIDRDAADKLLRAQLPERKINRPEKYNAALVAGIKSGLVCNTPYYSHNISDNNINAQMWLELIASSTVS